MLALLLFACDGGEATYPKDTGHPADSSSPDSEDSSKDSSVDSGRDTSDTGDSTDTDSSVIEETGDTGDSADTGEVVAGPAVILFIGDGMGFEHVEGGGVYLTGAAGSLTMETLPFQGRLRTASLSGLTDSAASSTAYATGSKTFNGMLGLDRDGLEIENLGERARSLGMSVGLVTTDDLTGATPSAQWVHVEDRGDSEVIAEAYLADMPDLAFGGGYLAFEDLLSSASVNLLRTSSDLAAAAYDGRPLLGLFADDTFPYVAQGYDADQPTLAEMTEAALGWLEGDPDGFFLLVEGARIDHASHGNDENSVYDEVVAFDEAIAVAMRWAASRDATLVVTADHECGGLSVGSTGTPGVVPPTEWRWGKHTNADVPVFATGTLATALDGVREDQLWVHEVLAAAIDGATSVTAPTVPTLVDGYTDDLGAQVTVQSQATSFGAGYNQLDGLRVTADADGLYVGVDGVFERGNNTAVVLLDLDYGSSTGWGAGTSLGDMIGEVDAAITTLDISVSASGVGFDAVSASLGAQECEQGLLTEEAGLRGLSGDVGRPEDFAWWDMISNFDDGNIADGSASADAGSTGLTENGWEMLLPWGSLYPSGIPASGATVALVVLLADDDGSYISNQALPPLSSATEPGNDAVSIESVVTISIDATGAVTTAAAVVP
ncbi:MAG: alkaline phosphatase [Deltaproteobacteria bacterium]|nr:alkaline phosphatase [Deltaproteobacteria bacterium]